MDVLYTVIAAGGRRQISLVSGPHSEAEGGGNAPETLVVNHRWNLKEEQKSTSPWCIIRALPAAGPK